MSEEMVCGRRTSTEWPTKAPDHWRADNTCSFCGSMRPDDLFKAIDQNQIITPTDKSYKIYVGDKWQKFYFQHLSKDEQAKFLELHNARKLNLTHPGYFYVLPFFARRNVG